MHCNLRQPNAAQSLSALISSPVQSLNSLSLSVAVERFYCLYVTLRCDIELWLRDLDLWPLTLNICGEPAMPYWNSVQNLSSLGQSAAELLQFELWPYDLVLHRVLSLCCGIVCTKFKLSRAIPSWNMMIFFDANTSCHAMTLTFDPLTLKVCGRSGGTWS